MRNSSKISWFLALILVLCFSASAFATSPTGWVQSGGKWFFYDSHHIKKTGWIYTNKWYYLNSQGIRQTGWVNDKGTWYYLDSGGAMQTGWLLYGGKTYYLTKSGAMQTGWLTLNGTTYFFDNSGAMQTGWVNNTGTWYYFNKGGVMQTGWLTLGGKTYYLQTNGAMSVGWKQIGTSWYDFQPDGSMAVNTVKDGYLIGANGVRGIYVATMSVADARQILAGKGWTDFGEGVGYNLTGSKADVFYAMITLTEENTTDAIFSIPNWTSPTNPEYSMVPDKVKSALQLFLPQTYGSIYQVIQDRFNGKDIHSSLNQKKVLDNREVVIQDNVTAVVVYIGKPYIHYDDNWQVIQ